MTNVKLTVVVAARPNFMKAAPLLHQLQKNSNRIDVQLVHTGQHYDYEMNQSFFDQLGIPAPDVNLEIGSGSHGKQTGETLIAFEQYLQDHQPDCVVVFGDVNSTVACALAASKLHIKVAHVEAGLRSFDRAMPEETNRILTDAISDRLYTPSADGDQHLLDQGIDPDKIKMVGNIMIDTLIKHKEDAINTNYFKTLGLSPKEYTVVTLHRPSNVDTKEALTPILEALNEIAKQSTVIFSMHPRTQQKIDVFGLNELVNMDGIKLNQVNAIGPKPYFDMLNLTMHAQCVITDSGGLQEETTVMGVPCLTLRNNTERPVTIKHGTNQLVKQEKEIILNAFNNAINRKGGFETPKFWDGKTAERIVKDLISWLS
jgi:UDP-N-acetylglucosamine 2-epimerase (non-hydrolysing)